MKQGFLRTAEALLAIAVGFAFLVAFIPDTVQEPAHENLDVLHPLRTDVSFRTCVLDRDVSCINSTLDARIGNRFSFAFNLSSDPDVVVAVPDAQVTASSLYIAGNTSNNETIIVRVFIWPQ